MMLRSLYNKSLVEPTCIGKNIDKAENPNKTGK